MGCVVSTADVEPDEIDEIQGLSGPDQERFVQFQLNLPPGMSKDLKLYYERAWRKMQTKRTCDICLEESTQMDMLCSRGSHAQLSVKEARDGCGHYACKDCMRSYVSSRIDERRYPVPCTSAAGGCTRFLIYGDVIKLLQETPKDLAVLQLLEVEHAIPAEQRFYCPYKECSALLMKSPTPCPGPSACPQCKKLFCLQCRHLGGHPGMSCAEFVRFGDASKREAAASDAAMIKLAAQEGWKTCPTCKNMVERSSGCHFMSCRCGCGFCYNCGLAYIARASTAMNVHGTPACKCGLFSYDHIL